MDGKTNMNSPSFNQWWETMGNLPITAYGMLGPI